MTSRFACMSSLCLFLFVAALPAQETPPASMVLHRGRFFVDRNENGVRDQGEAAVAGMTLVYGTRTWTTNRSGEYSVLTPVPMLWPIWFEIPPGYKVSGPWHLPIAGKEQGGKILEQDIPLFPGGVSAGSTVSILVVGVDPPSDDLASTTLRSALERVVRATQPELVVIATPVDETASTDPSRWPGVVKRIGAPVRFACGRGSTAAFEYHAAYGPKRSTVRLGPRRFLLSHPDAAGWLTHDVDAVAAGATVVIAADAQESAALDAYARAGAEVILTRAMKTTSVGNARCVDVPTFAPVGTNGEPEGYVLLTWAVGGPVDVKRIGPEVTASPDAPGAVPIESAAPINMTDDDAAPPADETAPPFNEEPLPRIQHRLVRGSLLRAWDAARQGAASDTSKTAKESTDVATAALSPTVVIAHRGGAAERAENTLSAIRRAIELGVAAVEIDVQLTADGEVVVFHDDVLPSGTPDAGKAVNDVTWSVLAGLDVGGKWGKEAPPRLGDVLALDWPASMRLMVEAKHGRDDGVLAVRIAALVAASSHKEVVVWGSIDPGLAGELSKLDPDVPLVGIVPTEAELTPFLLLPVDIWAISKEIATPAFIARLRSPRSRVWVWTVNDLVLARTLLDAGAEGLISDRPGAFIGR